ncbi:hypothetical protein [Antrihabitans cavernicola]|uniref:TniQ family protein n=1 Tax=Antrihabitans cavernicola TaxID=2495913 RepID=A0A5A7S9X3_9NOCA|nr:hypothetical protein [Spelaeibacter cavernicola]KAA0021373.1 hypothetical protein FOY51_19190 [Spelaeibacter cavernicola]
MELVVPQRLPLRTVPIRNEVLLLFLQRLAVGNGLPARYLLGVVRHTPPNPVATLAALTGHSIDVLTRTLPELREASVNLGERKLRPPPGFTGVGQPCRLCTARHGGRRITVWHNDEDCVCLRHHRWIGDGSTNQMVLQKAPEIVRANRIHRRLIVRIGAAAVREARAEAAGIIDRWHRRNALPAVTARAERLPGADPESYAAIAEHQLAAQYPAVVALTLLLTNATWVEDALSGPTGWNRARDQVARSVTGRYRPEGAHDPLIQWVNDRHPRWMELDAPSGPIVAIPRTVPPDSERRVLVLPGAVTHRSTAAVATITTSSRAD